MQSEIARQLRMIKAEDKLKLIAPYAAKREIKILLNKGKK